jgi:hypothetical protein
VRIWTAHEKFRTTPILVREGFAFGALLFGPLWLATNAAWIPAIITLALAILIATLVHPPASIVLLLGLAILLGFSGRDLVRWSVTRRGYLETSVVSGRTEDEAYARLLESRPDLLNRTLVAEAEP